MWQDLERLPSRHSDSRKRDRPDELPSSSRYISPGHRSKLSINPCVLFVRRVCMSACHSRSGLVVANASYVSQQSKSQAATPAPLNYQRADIEVVESFLHILPSASLHPQQATSVCECRRPLDESDRKDSKLSRDERGSSRRKRSRSPDRPRGYPRDEARESERRHRDRHDGFLLKTTMLGSCGMSMQVSASESLSFLPIKNLALQAVCSSDRRGQELLVQCCFALACTLHHRIA